MNIRPIKASDKAEVKAMMRVFYASPAVSTNGSEEIFEANTDACLSDSPFIEGYVFENGNELCGYAMLAKSFSTEFGKSCIWIEDIYIKPAFRGRGIAKEFFGFIHGKYSDHIFRLEAEEDNERAISVYKKAGYGTLPYLEMIKL